MELQDQLRRYFGVDDLYALTPSGLSAGIEKMRVEFGMETDRPRRFALWSMLHIFGAAPDLDVAFEEAEDRDAARNFMEVMERSAQEQAQGE